MVLLSDVMEAMRRFFAEEGAVCVGSDDEEAADGLRACLRGLGLLDEVGRALLLSDFEADWAGSSVAEAIEAVHEAMSCEDGTLGSLFIFKAAV
jgi:hypothetical protein